MSLVINSVEELQIRKAVAHDFYLLRRLPVQLCYPAASSLLLKKLRLMLQLADYEMLVYEHDGRVAAFMALQYSPAQNSQVRFLVIKHFAVDRFALTGRAAAEMEAYASNYAARQQITALVLDAEKISRAALIFYQSRGYRRDGDTLIKPINTL